MSPEPRDSVKPVSLVWVAWALGPATLVLAVAATWLAPFVDLVAGIWVFALVGHGLAALVTLATVFAFGLARLLRAGAESWCLLLYWLVVATLLVMREIVKPDTMEQLPPPAGMLEFGALLLALAAGLIGVSRALRRRAGYDAV